MGIDNIPLSADATSLDAAQANVLASAQSIAANLNANQLVFYNGAFDAFVTMVRAGRISNDNPPAVPKSFIVVKDSAGWASYVQTGPPVCDARPVPDDPNK